MATLALSLLLCRLLSLSFSLLRERGLVKGLLPLRGVPRTPGDELLPLAGARPVLLEGPGPRELGLRELLALLSLLLRVLEPPLLGSWAYLQESPKRQEPALPFQ